MPRTKQVVFISHISEEKEIAKIIKKHLEKSFLGIADIFVSSDTRSLTAGGRWLEVISDNLEKADVFIIICSQESVKRPWINFEAGAGWVKRVPVIPICHTNLKKNELPVPLDALQAVNASEGMEEVYEVIANTIDMGVPDFPDQLYNEISEFESRYGYYGKIENTVKEIIKGNPQLYPLFSLKGEPVVMGEIDSYSLDKINEKLELLQELNVLNYLVRGQISSNEGNFQNLQISITDNYINDIFPRIEIN